MVLGFCDLIVIHLFQGHCVSLYDFCSPSMSWHHFFSFMFLSRYVCSEFYILCWLLMLFSLLLARQSVGHRSLLALTLLVRLREYIRDSSSCNSLGPSLSLTKIIYFIFWLYLLSRLFLQSVSHRSLLSLVLLDRRRGYIRES
jgi:hypothetical protein